MHATVRWLFVALAATGLLVACTRERPVPEATATSAPAAAAEEQEPTPVREPKVETTAQEPADTQVATATAVLTPTTTPVVQETFQYVVQEGDTLGDIALRFDTDPETIRRLNNLEGDALYVGQPLYVPYVEGMTAEGAPTPTPGPFQYTIQPGDTLTGIAERFGVNPFTIAEANNLVDLNNLTVGATIIIPGYQPGPEAQPEAGAAAPAPEAGSDEFVIHVVRPGEGVLDIAAQYGVSADAIVEANNLVNPNMLRIGQELIIPGVSPQDAAAAQGNIHVVQVGESLLGIAVRYGVTVEEILEANEIENPDAIYEGQQLIIPTP
ncbi:MAG TPA: LysM peptidoglycan-binding domain-containing protein [Caldilineaceae bacterium]|nr:LysM peptidoglycan-binding domain-containing protein [Caldilineaceae bacterium]